MKNARAGHRRIFRDLFMILVVSAATVAGHAQTYTVADVGSLGGSQTTATAINNSGTIVGYSYTNASNYNAFSYSNGTISNIGSVGGGPSVAYGINNSGTIV